MMVLPDQLYSKLKKGLACVMATVGADEFPHIGFAWAAARDSNTIWFAVDTHSRARANIQRTRKAALEIVAPGNLLYLVQGDCAIVKEDIDAPPLAMSIAEMQVRDVRDQSWAGVQVAPLAFRFEGKGADKFIAAEKKALAALIAE